MGGINLRKFIVGLDENDALTSLSVWSRHPEIRDSLSESNVFDSADEARARLASLIAQAEADGVCEPGHECGRCIDWPPQVWDVKLSAAPVD